MALRDQPYLPLYIQDFLTDEKLIECSASATGVYIRLMCIMHKSEHYGKILLKQKYKQTDKQILNFASMLAKSFPYDVKVIEDALTELVDENVLQIEGDFLLQKRMVKDHEISTGRANNGKKGGQKTQEKNKKFASHFAKANKQANTEIEYEIEIDNENGLEKGGMLEKENQFPTDVNISQLTKADILTTQEFLKITAKTEWSENELMEHFEAFKIQNFTGKKFYEDHSAIITHFRNWMKSQKKSQINGITRTGKSAAIIAALKDLK